MQDMQGYNLKMQHKYAKLYTLICKNKKEEGMIKYQIGKNQLLFLLLWQHFIFEEQCKQYI